MNSLPKNNGAAATKPSAEENHKLHDDKVPPSLKQPCPPKAQGIPRLTPHSSLKDLGREYELEVHLPGHILKRIHLEEVAAAPAPASSSGDSCCGGAGGGQRQRRSLRIWGERRCRHDGSVVLSTFDERYEFDDGDADLGRARRLLSLGILLVVIPKKE